MASLDNLLARYDAAGSIGEKAAIWQAAADAQQRGEITWQQFTVIHQAYTRDSGQAIGGPLTHQPAYSTSGGGTPLGGTDMTQDAGIYGPRTEYLRRMGFAGGPTTMAERYMAGLYDPMRAVYEAAAPIGLAAKQPLGQWGDFMAQRGGVGPVGFGVQNVYNQARGALTNLFGMTPEQRALEGLAYEPDFDPLTGEEIRTEETQASRAGLQNLMRYGLASQLGGIASSWLAGRIPTMQQQWMGQGTQGGSFVDYLRQRYGL